MKLSYKEYQKHLEKLKDINNLQELVNLQLENFVGFKKQNLINASFNNTRGRALYTLLKMPIIVYQYAKLIKNEIANFHVGRLCIIKIDKNKMFTCELLFYDKENNLFFTKPININNFTLSKKERNYIHDIKKEFLENKIAFIYSNYTTNYIQSPLFINEKYLPLEIIKLNSGDIFAIPLTQAVIDFTTSANINSYWSINENGKYIFFEDREEIPVAFGKVIFQSVDSVWLYCNISI